MNNIKILENIQTGWVKWQFVRVMLHNQKKLVCEARVENLASNFPKCIVYIQMQNTNSKKLTLHFFLAPHKSETVTLTKVLPQLYSGIESIEIDEE